MKEITPNGRDNKDAGETALKSLAQVPAQPLTLDQARQELSGTQGRKYWQGLDVVASRPGFDRMVEQEFPQHASELIDPVSRRGFMKIMGASMALAGLSGCTKQPDEPIYPYIKQPEDLVLGKPLYFATAFPFPTGALPLLIKSDAFRPIKVDGNPDHPMSNGASDPISQGTLLGLYDPDRSPRVLHRGEQSQFAIFQAAFINAMQDKRSAGGQGLYILSGTVTSPTLAAQWKKAQAVYPQAKWIQYDPVNRDSARTASKAVFGDFYDAQYKLSDADVIVSLDADFLSGINQPGFVKLAGDFAARRRMVEPGSEDGSKMNRLYVIESSPTTTGFKADHRLAVRASDMPAFALALSSAVAPGGGTGGSPALTESLSETAKKFVAAVTKDLKASGGKCVVIPGEHAHASVHAAAMAMNESLGNVGKTVVYTETVNPMPTIQMDDFKSLVADMNAGKVEWLIILDSNPVYASPADVNFADALNNVKKVVHLGSHVDETARTAEWHINSAHYLEAWSDARAYDGTVTILQPMIDPLYGGKTAHDIIQSMLDDPAASTFDVVRGNWFSGGESSAGLDSGAQSSESVAMAGALTGESDAKWRKALHDGMIADSAFKPKTLSVKAGSMSPAAAPQKGAVEIIFRPDPSLYDGRFSNIGWLQELPKPVTNMSWDNAALMSHTTAAKLGLTEAMVITIEANGQKISAPLLPVPGHADDSITLYLGLGRQDAGRVGSGVGFNAYLLQNSATPLCIPSAKVTATKDIYEVTVTKSHYNDDRGQRAGGVGGGHNSLEGNEALTRGIVRYATLEDFRKSPGFAHEGVWPEDPEPTTTMFANYRYEKNAWGLVVDQNSCVGCNACIVSCYAENNIAVVGRHNVKTGRDMQWLRIDTYFEGDLEAPRAHFQPMMCQHCENAPCEQVCPVAATVHTPEGLNTMVYNRCVGTRYCSNNCPYKVRRFNFLLFSDYETESLKLMRNPDVTVRSRGVMEKCTYCVQRIMAAKIEADKENREIRDGEIVTACQQACPTSAITFGNINDKNSKVAKIKAQERNYGVIADVNTRPRTSYIAEVINPNSELSEV